jgi:hypothetical protein
VNAQYDAAVRRALPLLLFLTACGGPPINGVWVTEGNGSAEVTIAGETATMSLAGVGTTVYRQTVESRGDGYLLRWTAEDGEELKVDARLDGERLLLVLDGQEFALRRK